MRHPWSLSIDELKKKLDVDRLKGLKNEEAEKRLKECGYNCFTGGNPKLFDKLTVLRENLIKKQF